MLPEPEKIEDSNISIASCAGDGVDRPAKLVNASLRFDVKSDWRLREERSAAEEKPTKEFQSSPEVGETNPAALGESTAGQRNLLQKRPCYACPLSGVEVETSTPEARDVPKGGGKRRD